MEKTSPSMSYPKLLKTLDECLTEQKHRHFWLFLYSNRHAQLQLYKPNGNDDIDLHESEKLIHDTLDLLEKFDPIELMQILPDGEKLVALLNKFCFCITYAVHIKHVADGFTDIRFKELLPRYDAFLDTLTKDEKAVTCKIHELTYKYGFPITELWSPSIDSTELMEMFIKNHPRLNEIYSIPCFVFTKKSNHPKGIQISTNEYKNEPQDPWDLIIFINENDILSKVKKEVGTSWPNPEKQFIGNYNDFEIALYVDRGKCKISNALSTLRLQIDHLNEYKNGPLAILSAKQFSDIERINPKTGKEIRRRLAATIDSIRLSEGLISKRWTVYKSNVRRSIGLYLWDEINIFKGSGKSRKKLIIELIERLEAKAPKVLELYFGSYNINYSKKSIVKLKDLESPFETVIREMNADYDLTASCIENFEYLTPHDVKTGGKNINKN